MIQGYGTNTSGLKTASVSFAKKRPDQSIANETMEEIAERIEVNIEDDPVSDVSTIRSVSAPANTNALWQPIDENGVNTGAVKTFDALSGGWVDLGFATTEVAEPVKVPAIKVGVFVASGSGTYTIELPEAFADIESENIAMTFANYQGNQTHDIWVNTTASTEIEIQTNGQGDWMYIIAGEV